MQNKPESFQTNQLSLTKGQSYFGQLSSGTVIRVADGSVTLVQRTPLERCMLVQPKTMPCGAVHCAEVSTWVEIVAQSDANVSVMAPQEVSLVQELLAAWGTAWQRIGVLCTERRVS